MNKQGQGGSWEWKNSWIAISMHSNLAFDLVTLIIKT